MESTARYWKPVWAALERYWKTGAAATGRRQQDVRHTASVRGQNERQQFRADVSPVNGAHELSSSHLHRLPSTLLTRWLILRKGVRYEGRGEEVSTKSRAQSSSTLSFRKIPQIPILHAQLSIAQLSIGDCLSLRYMLRIVEPPRPCPYLPRERASLEIAFDPQLTPSQYGELLRRGYRRFGWQLFRPACRNCQACISMRVLVRDFQLKSSDRRVMRQNQDIHCHLAHAQVTRQHVEPLQSVSRLHACRTRLAAANPHHRLLFRSLRQRPCRHRLGMALFPGRPPRRCVLMDVAPHAVSLVYFFYDPAWRKHSPGRFSILNQLAHARQQDISYAYLGYWSKPVRR